MGVGRYPFGGGAGQNIEPGKATRLPSTRTHKKRQIRAFAQERGKKSEHFFGAAKKKNRGARTKEGKKGEKNGEESRGGVISFFSRERRKKKGGIPCVASEGRPDVPGAGGAKREESRFAGETASGPETFEEEERRREKGVMLLCT